MKKTIALVSAIALMGAMGAAQAQANKTYTQTCQMCHATGLAGSPKFGDKAAWKARIAEGKSTLYTHALHGFKGMPAKGGNPGLSDAAVKAAVDYMVAAAK